MDLMSSRQTGFGPGPIWWTTIQEYCNVNDLNEQQTETMHYYIKALDSVYLKRMLKK